MDDAKGGTIRVVIGILTRKKVLGPLTTVKVEEILTGRPMTRGGSTVRL